MSQFDEDRTKFIKYNANLNNYYFFKGGLSKQEIDRLTKQLHDEMKAESAQENSSNVGLKGAESIDEEIDEQITEGLHEGNVSGIIDKDYRDSRIHWIPKTEEWKWLYDKIGTYAYRANEAMWNFDISFMNEQIQFTEYDESYAGKYDWHLDIGSGVSSLRKIAIVVQLSEPSDYEGGELQLYTMKHTTTVPKDQGNVVCFPTYFLHRVTPVTKGRRRSLVLWVSGPPFR